MSDKKVTLIPIAMVRPTKGFIRAPSSNRPTIEVTQEEFMSQYADTAKAIPVSFDQDRKSNPTPTTAYTKNGHSLLGRFIKK